MCNPLPTRWDPLVPSWLHGPWLLLKACLVVLGAVLVLDVLVARSGVWGAACILGGPFIAGLLRGRGQGTPSTSAAPREPPPE